MGLPVVENNKYAFSERKKKKNNYIKEQKTPIRFNQTTPTSPQHHTFLQLEPVSPPSHQKTKSLFKSIETMAPCTKCNATGYVTLACDRCDATGRTSVEVPCSACNGFQIVTQDDGTPGPCGACGGLGSRFVESRCLHCVNGTFRRRCPVCN